MILIAVTSIPNVSESDSASVRDRVHPLMRTLLVIGTILVAVAAVQLYVLTDHTDRYFAWTIANPLTAATIGAFYIGAIVIAAMSAWQRRWHMARVGVPGVLVFLIFTGLATSVHHTTLHLHDSAAMPRIAAIAWYAIYIVDPVLLAVAYVLQLLRSRGVKPPKLAPLPPVYTRTCSTLGVVVIAAGTVLFAGTAWSAHWPWTLTPIASQAIGAWLMALGVLMVDVAGEGDALRARPATAGMIVLALAQFGALARYPHAAHGAAAIVYIVVFALVLVLGVYGLARSVTGRGSAATVPATA
jgi:hypothetical protein